MKFSIIIPTLNEEETLGVLLSSFDFDGKEREVIVVDGGSTDGTRKVARKHGARVIMEEGEEKSVASAKTQGVSVSKGSVIVFFEGDMERISDNFLDRIEEAFRKGARAVTWRSKLSEEATIWEKAHKAFVDTNLILMRKSQRDLIMALDKKLFYEVGGFNRQGYGEDEELDRKVRKKLDKDKIEEIDAVSYYRKTKKSKDIFKQAKWLGSTSSTPRKTLLYLGLLMCLLSIPFASVTFLLYPLTLAYLLRWGLSAWMYGIPGFILPASDFLYSVGYLSGVCGKKFKP